MASIVRNAFATSMAAAFIDKFGQGSSANDNLFMAIGKALNWTSEPTPDAVDASFDTKATFEQFAIAAKRIEKTNVQMVIPKVIWTTATTYNIVDTSAADPLAATDFYVVTSNSEVFICTTKGGGTSTVEPTEAQDGVTLADGYVWEFMYTVSGTASKANTTNWLPVNFGSSVAVGDNPESYRRLGVDNIMIVGVIDDTITYTADDYRQVAIYKNLVEVAGSPLAASNEYQIVDTTWQTGTNDNDLAALVGLADSDMIYLENREKITRVATQVEELKIILSLG